LARSLTRSGRCSLLILRGVEGRRLPPPPKLLSVRAAGRACFAVSPHGVDHRESANFDAGGWSAGAPRARSCTDRCSSISTPTTRTRSSGSLTAMLGHEIDPVEAYRRSRTAGLGDYRSRPDTCRRKIGRFAREWGSDRRMCLMQVGHLPHDAVLAGIRRVGESSSRSTAPTGAARMNASTTRFAGQRSSSVSGRRCGQGAPRSASPRRGCCRRWSSSSILTTTARRAVRPPSVFSAAIYPTTSTWVRVRLVARGLVGPLSRLSDSPPLS